MIERTIDVFTDAIYYKPSERIYKSNRTNVYDIDDTWVLDILDLKDH